MNDIYTRGFVWGDASSASAATVVLVSLVLLVVLVQFRLMRAPEDNAA
jgi:multiple sugar transport system permease protein